VIVFLDSNHSEVHDLNELELYSPFVSLDSYIVAHDGAQSGLWNPCGKPSWKADNPMGAIRNFLAEPPRIYQRPWPHPLRYYFFTRWLAEENLYY
jgi:cephalosporin hydroxylase